MISVDRQMVALRDVEIECRSTRGLLEMAWRESSIQRKGATRWGAPWVSAVL